MLKSVVLLFVLLVALGNIHAYSQRSWTIALKGGLSIPNLTSGNSFNPVNSGYSSRLGADAAVYAELCLSKHFSIQSQLEYSEQGGKKNGNKAFAVPAGMTDMFPAGQVPPCLFANYKRVAKINYLLLPLFARIFTRLMAISYCIDHLH